MNCAKNKLVVCRSYKLTIPKSGCTKQMLVVKVDTCVGTIIMATSSTERLLGGVGTVMRHV